jgi:hypothetical protein
MFRCVCLASQACCPPSPLFDFTLFDFTLFDFTLFDFTFPFCVQGLRLYFDIEKRQGQVEKKMGKITTKTNDMLETRRSTVGGALCVVCVRVCVCEFCFLRACVCVCVVGYMCMCILLELSVFLRVCVRVCVFGYLCMCILVEPSVFMCCYCPYLFEVHRLCPNTLQVIDHPPHL